MTGRLVRLMIDLGALSLPFVVGLGAALWVIDGARPAPVAEPDEAGQIQHQYDLNTELPTAVVLLDPTVTDQTGMLASYGILGRSGRYNVFAVAKHRTLAPVGYGVAAMPHFAFDEMLSAVERRPRVVVIPHRTSLEDPDVAGWTAELISDSTWFVVGCDRPGGLPLVGRDPSIEETVVAWIESFRSLCDGLLQNSPERVRETKRTVVSSGATALIDATLRVLAASADDDAARQTADRAGYRLSWRDPAPGSLKLTTGERIGRYLVAGFVWDKSNVAVALFEDVDELALGAVLDLHPHVYDADVMTLGRSRESIQSRHGLILVPQLGLVEQPKVHEIVLPGEPPPDELEAFLEYAEEEEVPMYNPFGGTNSDRFEYDTIVERTAAIRGRAAARAAAKSALYPVDQLSLDSAQRWPYDVLVVPLTFGFLIIFVLRLARKRRIASAKMPVTG